MSKSIRISDELAEFADAAASVAHRSPPQQIEHWAQVGRVLESALSYSVVSQIKRVGRADLDAILDSVPTPEAKGKAQAVIRRTSGSIESVE